jgi:hypothetical protein
MNQIVELSNMDLIDRVPAITTTEPREDVSDRYMFVSTLDAINYIRDAGWVPVMAQQTSSRKVNNTAFNKHLIRFTRPDLVVGEHRMDLLLYNSHNRGCSFKLIGGVFRFVCANGMVIGDTMAEYTHRHVGFNPDIFLESVDHVNTYMENTTEVIEDWQNTVLSINEQKVFAQIAHQYVYPDTKKAPIRSNQLLEARRYGDNCTDLWTTFNKIQENATKGGLKGVNQKNKRTTTRAVKSIDKDIKLNKALWNMAKEMYKLKTN